MSRTYRRRNPSPKNNTNFPACPYYSDSYLMNKHLCGDSYGKWESVNNCVEKDIKAYLAYYHSDYYYNSFSKKYKKVLIKNSFKSLRRINNIKLNNFILFGNKEEFNDIISHKPNSVLWQVY